MMSYPPDDRHERDSHPPRIASSNTTLDKEKYDKNSIRSPQPADGVNMYEMQNFKKSLQSRPIAPASVTHASLNPTSAYLPHNFGAMYSMMQSPVPYLRPDFPFARHIMPLQVSATAGVPSRPTLGVGQPGRGLPPPIGHHLKPSGLQNPVHAISIHPSANLQQPRTPSPQPLQDSGTSDGPKGDIKSQATPTEARSVSEARPSMNSEPASRVALNQGTPIITASKTLTPISHVPNTLNLAGGLTAAPLFGKTIPTAPPRMSTTERVIPRTSSSGHPPSVTSNLMPIPYVGPSPNMNTLYSQPAVSFAQRPPQFQDHNRLLKANINNTASSAGSFVGHTGSATTVASTSVPSMASARMDLHRPHPCSLYYDAGHPGTSSLQPSMKPFPIESVVRKPTTLTQVPGNLTTPSPGHVTTGVNPVQLMTSPSVAVVNMGVSYPNTDVNADNTSGYSAPPSNNSPSIFSVQNMLSTTQASSANSQPSSTITSSPRPSILRKRQEVTRKPSGQPSSADHAVISTNDMSASPRSDHALSHSRQNSPKSEPVEHKPMLENGTSHASPSKVKRELLPSAPSPPVSATGHLPKPAAVPQDIGASPRKKPRKQNVIATEDKYSSSPMQVDTCDMTNTVNEKVDQEEDEELKFLMLKRRCVSIYGGYKVNSKAAHNHFQRYSDVKVKDERKPSLQEIASERSVAQRATGWKIHHVAAQLDDLKTSEEEVLRKMYEFRERLPKYKPEHKRYDDMVMLHELLQGNIQRSQLVIEQLGETKKTTVKILDHKSGIIDILQKNIRRNPKKKS